MRLAQLPQHKEGIASGVLQYCPAVLSSVTSVPIVHIYNRCHLLGRGLISVYLCTTRGVLAQHLVDENMQHTREVNSVVKSNNLFNLQKEHAKLLCVGHT